MAKRTHSFANASAALEASGSYTAKFNVENNPHELLTFINHNSFATVIASLPPAAAGNGKSTDSSSATPAQQQSHLWIAHIPMRIVRRDNDNAGSGNGNGNNNSSGSWDWSDYELRGHIARANGLHRFLPDLSLSSDPTQCVSGVAIFHGSHGYISPTWYYSDDERRNAVPTWNYAAVHVQGSLHRVDPFPQSELDALVSSNESSYNASGPAKQASNGEASAYPSLYSAAAFVSSQSLSAQRSGIVGVTLRVQSVLGKFKLSQNKTAEVQSSIVASLRQNGNNELAEQMQRTLQLKPSKL